MLPSDISKWCRSRKSIKFSFFRGCIAANYLWMWTSCSHWSDTSLSCFGWANKFYFVSTAWENTGDRCQWTVPKNGVWAQYLSFSSLHLMLRDSMRSTAKLITNISVSVRVWEECERNDYDMIRGRHPRSPAYLPRSVFSRWPHVPPVASLRVRGRRVNLTQMRLCECSTEERTLMMKIVYLTVWTGVHVLLKLNMFGIESHTHTHTANETVVYKGMHCTRCEPMRRHTDTYSCLVPCYTMPRLIKMHYI